MNSYQTVCKQFEYIRYSEYVFIIKSNDGYYNGINHKKKNPFHHEYIDNRHGFVPIATSMCMRLCVWVGGGEL